MPTTIEVSTPDGPMRVYDAEPEGDTRGAIVVIQEAFGVNGHIEDVTRRFASQGYRAVSPHLFHRSGDPALGYDDISQVMPHMQAMSHDGLIADLDATLAYLADAGFAQKQTGMVGFCMGGTVAFYASCQYPLGAGVGFYGGGVAGGRFGFPSQIEMAPQLQAPWLGLFGDQDKGIPVEEVEDLRAAASKASVPSEVVRYAEAEHGFHCDARASYHRASAEDAWKRTLDWFADNLAKP
ncbi:MAG TPA: dienelactone hydrolase family protein [Acidimicrobiales bacterium]|nr:dienelactone hydrolase family protein [Acidimicrobiales bacterium]